MSWLKQVPVAIALMACVSSSMVHAGSAVVATPAAQQAQWLQSADPKLAANKKLVFDFWREVLEAGHLEKTAVYVSDNYIQHNPNIGDGRVAFEAFFKPLIPVRPIKPQIQAPLVSIVAEGSLVTLVFVQQVPAGGGTSYTTTAFDMFRIENGKIVEHWDSMLKQ